MSGSNNNLSYSHWKTNLSLMGNSSVTSPQHYQSIMKLSNATGSAMHHHHSPQLSEEHLMPAHSTHSPHSMRLMASPGSSTSMYSPGSTSSTPGVILPTSIPHAHQQNVPPIIQNTASYSEQNHHIDVYSPIGMQRIGQMFKTNLIANNNNAHCNNKNTKNSNQSYESVGKMEQSMNNIKQLVESAIGIEAKQQIMYILEKISLLQPPERLLLYLRMPSSTSETDPLRQPQNPLGTRSEINFTINWVKSHLEMDPNVSIPKQDVYDEYVAYCTRGDVKPLSTADFGKVMKQIFPSIRPRRLGTRGNSRYCYAAMRKTTKLECPQLPNLSEPKSFLDSNARLSSNNTDDDDGNPIGSNKSWEIIKSWAESLLDTEFRDANQLAEHITLNYINGGSGAITNNSRTLLQKKLLQQKVKGRKKKFLEKYTSLANEVTGDGKRRRKKKMKKSLNRASESIGDNELCAVSTNDHDVPDELMHIKQECKTHSNHSLSTDSQSQSMMPMNLTNEQGKVKCEPDPNNIESNISEPEMNPYVNPVCKIEIEDVSDVEQTVLCKKVRRAQESKGLSVSISSPKMHSPDKGATLSPASILMRPPLTDTQPTDLSVNNDAAMNSSDVNRMELSVPSTNKRSMDNSMGRTKKLRFNRHASVAGMNETKVDDIATDIIIPRERVVSICNMDKDALDDYLNEGGDSQEQEAELLQFFQPANANQGDKNATETVITSVNTSHNISEPISNPTSSNVYPILENYQLHPNIAPNENRVEPHPHIASTMSSSAQVLKKQEQIDELRQYLQQNLHHQSIAKSNSNTEEQTVSSSSQVDSIEMQFDSHESTSNAIGTFPSYGQTNRNNSNTNSNGSASNQNLVQKSTNPVSTHLMRNGSSTSNHTQQSPNSRCKNFSFVPISPGPQSPRANLQNISQLQSNIYALQGKNSTFLSPRKSPAVKRSMNKDFCLKSIREMASSTCEIPLMSKNEISASAPASPSMASHHFHFNNSLLSSYPTNSSSNATSKANTPRLQIAQQHQTPYSLPSSDSCSMESRSQSVPLHCQSPISNTSMSNTAYNSVCHSVAQTPVPSEFADFSESEALLDMIGDHNIKIESSDVPNMIDIRGNLSRSVPSTPLPVPYQFHSLSNFGSSPLHVATNSSGLLITTSIRKCDASKSVPTTPNALRNCFTPFQQNPDLRRDFLINGNTIDAVKASQFYASMQEPSLSIQPSQPRVIVMQQTVSERLRSNSRMPSNNESLEVIPNYDVNDPIIEGTVLMNSL